MCVEAFYSSAHRLSLDKTGPRTHPPGGARAAGFTRNRCVFGKGRRARGLEQGKLGARTGRVYEQLQRDARPCAGESSVIAAMERPSTDPASIHQSVMVREVIDALAVKPAGDYVDCTVGLGGHAEAILNAGFPGRTSARYGLDPAALHLAQERLAGYESRALLVEGNFAANERCDRESWLCTCPGHPFRPGSLFTSSWTTLSVGLASGRTLLWT